MKQESRRVKQTKELLNESLLFFLEKKEIHQISITEICNYADINRTTYYRYFNNPSDQLSKIEDNLFSELDKYVYDIIKTNKNPDSYFQSMLAYLTYLDSKKHMLNILIKCTPKNQFLPNFIDHMYGVLNATCPFNIQSSNGIYAYTFASFGCIGLIVRWLTSEDTLDVHTIARLMTEYTSYFTI